jgi:hypothetical protein
MAVARTALKAQLQNLLRPVLASLASLVMALTATTAHAQDPTRVIDIPTRPGVTQRFNGLEADVVSKIAGWMLAAKP